MKEENQNFIVECLRKNYYKATNTGEILSFKINSMGVVLIPSISNWGYKRCLLYNEKGRRKFLSVHHIVWLYFKGPIPQGLEIHHKNGNKLDNSMSNLELMTKKQNVKHAYDTGLKLGSQGEKHGAVKLTNEQVLKIRSLYKANTFGYLKISRLYNISREHIRDIIKRRCWTHI